MIKTVVFDIGNVVWRYRPLQTRLFHLWAKHLGRSVHDFRIHLYEKDGLYRLFETDNLTLSDWVSQISPSLNSDLFYRDLEEVYGDPLIFSRYFNPSIVSLIKHLHHQGFSVGCLSNTENFFYPYLKQNILPLFDYHLLSWQLKSRKPDPKIFQEIFRHVSCLPSEVVFIDDVIPNVEAGRRLGINALLFQNITQLKKDLLYLTNPKG